MTVLQEEQKENLGRIRGKSKGKMPFNLVYVSAGYLICLIIFKYVIPSLSIGEYP